MTYKEAIKNYVKHLTALKAAYNKLLDITIEQGLPRPIKPDVLKYEWVVLESENFCRIYTSLSEAYTDVTGRTDRKMNWRDAPGAFRRLGYTLKRVEVERNVQ